MIIVQLNKKDFEYDIHSLVKAFYQDENVKICYEPPEDETEASLILVISYELEAGRGGLKASLFRPGGEALLAMEEALEAGADRKETKNSLKRLIYRLLSQHTGKTLPWGNLTGIRPVKIPMALMKEGWSNGQIAEYMRNTYYTSREKTALAVAVANQERHILEGLDYKNGYSLYIGIPFCPSICLYCSFSSSPIALWKGQVERYLEALFKEIEFGAQAFAGKTLNTIYIGGGTPTTLEAGQLDRLLDKLEKSFSWSHLQEFTVEAGRPDSITEEKLREMKDHGITRISINPQTMNQKTLDLIGRRHTVEETKEAFALARSLGFDNINMDLIAGLPGEGTKEMAHTLEEISGLDPDSVTVHSLAVKRASRLHELLEEYKGTFSNTEEIMDLAADYARRAGMFPYYLYRQKNMAGNFENVGYAKAGKAGIYNILIMEEVQSILALGAGASTKMVWASDRIERIENVKDIHSYLERIDEMIDRKRSGIYGGKGAGI